MTENPYEGLPKKSIVSEQSETGAIPARPTMFDRLVTVEGQINSLFAGAGEVEEILAAQRASIDQIMRELGLT